MGIVKQKKMVVVLEESVKLPFRKESESLTRTFKVYAKTKQGAIKAVRSAGHKGQIVEVIVNG